MLLLSPPSNKSSVSRTAEKPLTFCYDTRRKTCFTHWVDASQQEVLMSGPRPPRC